jgi:hypothetical protein
LVLELELVLEFLVLDWDDVAKEGYLVLAFSAAEV